MASKKYRRSGTNRKRSLSKSRNHKGGRKSSRRTRTDKKKKTHKWHQKGCQSGGGSITGGWPWGPSDVQHQTAGSSTGAQQVPYSINGNHYAHNTATNAPPQSSNHLVEKGQYGGKRRRRRFIGEQHGGTAAFLPEVANSSVRGMLEIPASVANSLQGASTAFKTSDPTVQPIGNPIQLK
jgi:hypothetical protein